MVLTDNAVVDAVDFVVAAVVVAEVQCHHHLVRQICVECLDNHVRQPCLIDAIENLMIDDVRLRRGKCYRRVVVDVDVVVPHEVEVLFVEPRVVMCAAVPQLEEIHALVQIHAIHAVVLHEDVVHREAEAVDVAVNEAL